MPIGSYTFVPEIASYLENHRPSSVLDLGIGSGFYGAVIRQWADSGSKPWQTYLAGVEFWSAYRNPLWDLYDVIVETTIEEFLAAQGTTYDLILMLDVIEHFEHDTGSNLLARLEQLLSPGGRCYVGSPAIFVPQGACHGNELEVHRSLWSSDDLEARGFEVLRDGGRCPYGSQMLLGYLEKAA